MKKILYFVIGLLSIIGGISVILLFFGYRPCIGNETVIDWDMVQSISSIAGVIVTMAAVIVALFSNISSTKSMDKQLYAMNNQLKIMQNQMDIERKNFEEIQKQTKIAQEQINISLRELNDGKSSIQDSATQKHIKDLLLNFNILCRCVHNISIQMGCKPLTEKNVEDKED